ncbi:MAG: RNA-guided endonuclease TnpB family protein [Lachnospiraceae bacterium]|nr:transposase [Lachnospiraceae bacterium]MDD7701692.1 RNA-guided endonuclease TnpB family protein [Lachnospiraceae bacterium]MDY3302220.1 RNA-guided endonuclease TnpB family protein [Lachnospiraceae bacterium]MEE3379345.1 RNA-guided endonuclease TnpB family protein [Lachnospiraceae bacterium]MEE3432923.1 RNA-guided endonuclease TnpB family protein [Lachnospiraceae bacterium]
MANRAIKYRIYPTTEQKIMFAKTFGCCRKVYNLMLNDKLEGYKATGKFPTVTPAKYKKDYPYLKEVDSLALSNKQLDLQAAFRNAFSKTRKKNNNFPKFKSKKHSRKSYTTNNQKGTVAIIDNRYIKLPKVGKIKAVIHRIPDSRWIIKSATVSQESDGKFYTSVLFDFELVENDYIADKTNAIGLDYALDGLYVDNNGIVGSSHKYYRESHRKLAKEQRKLSRKAGSKKNEIKSNNYLKQLRKVNKVHRHIANQRLDHLHKISTKIANQYDVVCVESLNMRSMANHGFGNGKATLDNGYGMFLSMLEYKLSDRNKFLIKVDKWFPSSQRCHCCGKIHPEMKSLQTRIIKCDCGLTMSRDQNAAINILHEGLRLLAETD